MVTGPSLCISTSMCAPKTPVSTGTPWSRSTWTKCSTSGSATSGIAASVKPGRRPQHGFHEFLKLQLNYAKHCDRYVYCQSSKCAGMSYRLAIQFILHRINQGHKVSSNKQPVKIWKRLLREVSPYFTCPNITRNIEILEIVRLEDVIMVGWCPLLVKPYSFLCTS